MTADATIAAPAIVGTGGTPDGRSAGVMYIITTTRREKNTDTTLVSTPMMASQVSSAFTAALNTYHFAMKPPKGGKPPSESRNIVISAASTGRSVHSPA